MEYDGKTYKVGQANHVFVFPGIGLACLTAHVREVTDSTFLIAAHTLADCASESRLESGAIFPSQSDLRKVSARVATAVVREAIRTGVAGMDVQTDVGNAVQQAMWLPQY